MVNISETYHYRVTKQPNTVEETDQLYDTKPRNIELAPSINSSTSIMCGDLLRCLCWCCYLVADNLNSDGDCCSGECCDCDCNGCENCDCGGCDNCDCSGCNC